MGKFDELGAFVQPHHLEASELLAYQEAFVSHPTRMLTLKSFLHSHVAEKITRFLTNEAVYRPRYGLYSAVGSRNDIAEDEWLKAEEKDRFFLYRVVDWEKISPEFRLSPNLIIFLKFRSAVVQSGFKLFLEAISGLPLGASTVVTVHATKKGEFLRTHDDRDNNRRLAFVLYLSAHWPPRFGGALSVVDHGQNVTEIEAEYNSLVVFDVTAHKAHFITPVSPAAGERSRLSIGGWITNPR